MSVFFYFSIRPTGISAHTQKLRVRIEFWSTRATVNTAKSLNYSWGNCKAQCVLDLGTIPQIPNRNTPTHPPSSLGPALTLPAKRQFHVLLREHAVRTVHSLNPAEPRNLLKMFSVRIAPPATCRFLLILHQCPLTLTLPLSSHKQPLTRAIYRLPDLKFTTCYLSQYKLLSMSLSILLHTVCWSLPLLIPQYLKTHTTDILQTQGCLRFIRSHCICAVSIWIDRNWMFQLFIHNILWLILASPLVCQLPFMNCSTLCSSVRVNTDPFSVHYLWI